MDASRFQGYVGGRESDDVLSKLWSSPLVLCGWGWINNLSVSGQQAMWDTDLAEVSRQLPGSLSVRWAEEPL